MNIQFSASALGNRNTGQGGGANLLLANAFSPTYGAPSSQRTLDRPAASTADYYHLSGGPYWARPFDLEAMGTWGQSIAASKGFRYVWFLGPDHPDSNFGYGRDSNFIYVAYSNDPSILPDPSTMKPIISGGGQGLSVTGAGGVYNTVMFPWFVYNPDEAADKGYLYAQGFDVNGTATPNPSWNTILFSSADLDTFACVGLSHLATGSNGFVAAQTVRRNGTGDWVSWGGGNPAANDGSIALWTSIDGKTFAKDHTITHSVSSRSFDLQNDSLPASVGGNSYCLCREDARSADGGMYVSLAPVNSDGSLITTGTPPIIRVSNKHQGVFPNATYLQSVSGYLEDGILTSWAERGFFADISGFTGIKEQFHDLYYYIADAAAAAAAAPLGVRASADSGIATISWYDAPAGRTYRIYRGTSLGSQPTLVGDVIGTSITNTPTAGSVYYYKVVALNGGSEAGSRIVSTYVSSSGAFVNQHITRALAAGADASTIDRTWLDTVAAWLTPADDLLHWVDPSFGVVKDGSNVISRVMCLGTTRLPRGGDYTPSTSTSTYDATQFNSSVPGVVNANTTSFGYFGGYGRGTSTLGRMNQIRRKPGATLVAAYKKANSSLTTLLAIGEAKGMSLQHTAGSPGSASFKVYDSGWNSTSTLAFSGSGSRIIAGVNDGLNAVVYVDGVAGTAGGAIQGTASIDGFVGEVAAYLINSGSESSKLNQNALSVGGTYVFSNNQAQKTDAALIVFGSALSASRIASLHTMLRSRIGA